MSKHRRKFEELRKVYNLDPNLDINNISTKDSDSMNETIGNIISYLSYLHQERTQLNNEKKRIAKIIESFDLQCLQNVENLKKKNDKQLKEKKLTDQDFLTNISICI